MPGFVDVYWIYSVFGILIKYRVTLLSLFWGKL